jgi:hypothetical protein
MPTILEELKLRLAAAQARHLAAQQKHQAATAELNAATVDFNVWNSAVSVETREEAARVAEAAKNQLPMALIEEPSPLEPTQTENQEEEDEPVNKTEFIRELLRQNHAGMTPAAIWAAFHAQAPKASRQYMYSVLKRLRDKKEVDQKRGKYVLKVKPISEEAAADDKEGLFVN